MSASYTIDPVSLKPDYRLIYKRQEQRSAFNIASTLGLKRSIIENAKKILKTKLSEKDKLIDSIIEDKRMLSTKISLYKKRLLDIKIKEEKLRIAEDSLEKEKTTWKQKVLQEELWEIKKIRQRALRDYKEIYDRKMEFEPKIQKHIQSIDKAFIETKR